MSKKQPSVRSSSLGTDWKDIPWRKLVGTVSDQDCE